MSSGNPESNVAGWLADKYFSNTHIENCLQSCHFVFHFYFICEQNGIRMLKSGVQNLTLDEIQVAANDPNFLQAFKDRILFLFDKTMFFQHTRLIFESNCTNIFQRCWA